MDEIQRYLDTIRRAADLAAPFREHLNPLGSHLESFQRISETLNLGIGSEVRKFLDALSESRAQALKLTGPDPGLALSQIDHVFPKIKNLEDVTKAVTRDSLFALSNWNHNVGARFASDAMKIGSVVRASLPNFGTIAATFEALSELERLYGRELAENWDDLTATELVDRLELLKQRELGGVVDDHDSGELERLQASVDASTEAIRNLATQVEASASPWSGLGRDIALNLIFGLMFMLLQNIMDQRETEEAKLRSQRTADAVEASLVVQDEINQRLARIEDMQRQMQDAMSTFEASLDAMPPNGIVRERTALRIRAGGRVVGHLDVGQEFLVLNKDGKWIEVRFRDRDDHLVVGWVRKKHCSAIALDPWVSPGA
mgnify:CR=1 FL=1